MANPSPAAIAWIQSAVADWSLSDAAIAMALNARMVANPADRPIVPLPFAVGDLLGVLDSGAMGNLGHHPSLPRILDDIAAMNRPGLMMWVTTLAAAGDITAPQRTALEAILAATGPDPAWPNEVPEPVVHIGRLVDPDDIAAARPAGA